MPWYIYQTTLSEDNEGFPSSNQEDLTDFLENYKNSAEPVSSLSASEGVSIRIDSSYSSFKDRVSNWSLVKYTKRGPRYELFYIISV